MKRTRIGYTVIVDRTKQQPRAGVIEVVGSVHKTREPAENHLNYCQGMAERRGDDARYAVVEVWEVSL